MAYKGRVYKLTPDYRNVLDMYKSSEGDLTDSEKVDIMLHYLIKGQYPIDIGLLETVINAIFQPAKSSTQKVFDFTQDAQYIYSGFLQTYGIDLFGIKYLHWWKFCALLYGLPDDTKFAQIVQIRLRPMPQPTKGNAKERAELARLKMQYRLEISEAERQENLQRGLHKMAECLMGMAKS